MEEKKMTEGRIALISALIAIPASVLIGMLIHHSVPVPEEPLFCSSDPAPEAAVPEIPRKPRPEAPAPGEPRKAPPEPMDLTQLYQKKVDLAGAALKELEKNFKNGQITLISVEKARCEFLLAEGEKYRYEKKIRRWGSSISDLAIRYEYAKKYARDISLQFKSGSATLLDVNQAEREMIDLEIQLKNSRIYTNEAWQKAYAEFQKSPGSKTYHAMLEAEQAAQPKRRF